jgi:predicted small lipoprotein YifL
MTGVPQILGAARRALLFFFAAALLGACGQKGPLFLPTGEAAASRATLPETLAPSTSVIVPTPAASSPPTGIAVPAPRP